MTSETPGPGVEGPLGDVVADVAQPLHPTAGEAAVVAEPEWVPAPRPPVTGDQSVDEAMELVADAFTADLDGQLEAYEAAHQTLQDRLADVES